MDFPSTSDRLRRDYLEAGFSNEHADRLSKGQTLMAKVENATTLDEVRDVMRDLVRDLYGLGHPVPPPQTAEARAVSDQAARSAR